MNEYIENNHINNHTNIDNTFPAWMTDELVRDIPLKKLEFLNHLCNEYHGHTPNEMMSSLIPIMQKAKQENLNFTKTEVNLVITSMKKHSTDTEKIKIEQFLKEHKPTS